MNYIKRCYTSHTGLFIKRNPLITSPLEPIESNYLIWRSIQQRQEAKPFSPDFYFKKGSLAEEEYKNRVEALPTRELDTKEDSNLQSLRRLQDQTLYFVVNHLKYGWIFPFDQVKEDEFLDSSADRQLIETVGKSMDIWRVGNKPVGVSTLPNENYIYYMKCHVISGQVETSNEYAWCTRDELKEKMSTEYYDQVKDMM